MSHSVRHTAISGSLGFGGALLGESLWRFGGSRQVGICALSPLQPGSSASICFIYWRLWPILFGKTIPLKMNTTGSVES